VWRNTLEAFIDHQRADGLFPRKVAAFGNAERNLRSILAQRGIALPVSRTLAPEYRTAGWAGKTRLEKWAASILLGTAGEPKDTNPLILLSIAELARNEPAFLLRHEEAVKKALAYLDLHTRDGLLWQYEHEDWLDVYGRQGHVLYTNVLYAASLTALAKALRLRDRRLAAQLVLKARRVRARLQELWDPERGHFISHCDETGTHRQFATEGNVLAILTGVADARQRRSILDTLETIVEEYGYVPIVAPSYPAWMQSGIRRVFLWKYRDGRLLKPWLQILAAKAAVRERPGFAATLLAQVARVFVDHGCCEVLNGHTGRPHEFFLTRTEKRFTAAAALYLEVFGRLFASTAG
jgi:mannosylglycerate hydrolase MGH1-like protein